MSPLGAEMLADLPPVLREDPDIQAVLHVRGREAERSRALVGRIRGNFFPQTADEMGLPWHEALLGLAIEPLNKTVAERRTEVLAIYRSRHGGSGESWERLLQELGITYHEEHVPGDPEGPPAYTVRVYVPFPSESNDYTRLHSRLRAALPANTELLLVSTAAFILDYSRMDIDDFGA